MARLGMGRQYGVLRGKIRVGEFNSAVNLAGSAFRVSTTYYSGKQVRGKLHGGLKSCTASFAGRNCPAIHFRQVPVGAAARLKVSRSLNNLTTASEVVWTKFSISVSFSISLFLPHLSDSDRDRTRAVQ